MRFIESQKEVFQVLKNRSKYPNADRKRAYLFLFIYCIGILAFSLYFLHFVGGWAAAALVCLIQLIMVVIYAFHINDYRDKSLNSLECERAVNPVLEGYFFLRCVQLIHAFFLRSYVMTLLFALNIIYIIWRYKKKCFFVEATLLWKDAGTLETESYKHVGWEFLLLISVTVCMIVSIITEYS